MLKAQINHQMIVNDKVKRYGQDVKQNKKLASPGTVSTRLQKAVQYSENFIRKI